MCGFENRHALVSDFSLSEDEIGKSSRMEEHQPAYRIHIKPTTWTEFGIQLASFKIRDTTYTANGCASSTSKDVGWCGVEEPKRGLYLFIENSSQLSLELKEFSG